MELEQEEIKNLEDKDTGLVNYLRLNQSDNSILKNININESEANPTKANEYITKGRKTLFNPSILNMESPKKENPSRSKRITLIRKSINNEIQNDPQGNKLNNELNFNIDVLSNLTFGDPSGHSSKIINDELLNMDQTINDNSRYKFLVKKIAMRLKKRVKLPKCKIFKFHYPYRKLILRISNGIKKTAKKLNFWEKWENKIENNANSSKTMEQGRNSSKRNIKIRLSGMKKNDSKDSLKINISLIKKSIENKNQSNNEKNILFLKNLNISNDNNLFINQFSNFLEKNGIEICSENKLPIFKNNDNKYLISEYEFWIKYINYISMKYKNSLTIYNLVNFIEQFYIWIDKDKNNNINYNRFNNEIINQINLLFDFNTIDNFLLMNKIKNINDLFARYKSIYIPNYKEIKINEECECPTCKNLYKEKVINFNKKNNRISYASDNSLSYEIPLNKFSESKTLLDKHSHIRYTIGAQVTKTNKENNSIEKNEKDEENKNKKISDYFDSNEKKDKEEDKKEEKSKKSKRSKSKKSKNNSKSKNKSKDKDKKEKKKSEMQVQDIFDILSIVSDQQNKDDSNEDNKGKKRNKSKKNKKK